MDMKVALVCIARDEDHYIGEWTDYHTKLGFNDIWIYQNNWRVNVKGGNIHLVEFDGAVKQLLAYNTFIANYHNNYDWACFMDVDEFLVLKKHPNIQAFISDYLKYDCIAVNWHLFGNNGHEKVVGNDYSLIRRFTKRGKHINPHIKTIVKLKDLKPAYINPHHTHINWVDPNFNVGTGPRNGRYRSDNIAQINHYFCKTKEEFIKKVNRGHADQIGNLRPVELDYDRHNCNDVEDLWAYNFMFKRPLSPIRSQTSKINTVSVKRQIIKIP